MKLRFALPAVLATALFGAAAHADTVLVDFTGTVSSETGTSYAVGAAISGSFAYDTTSASFLSFAVGGQHIPTGYTSSVSFTPDMYSAFYIAQISPLQPGVTVNRTFTLDLEAANGPWTSANPIALLSDSAQLAGNLDPSMSNFGFYMANADGTAVQSLSAQLNSVEVVAAVPEPGTTALVSLGLLAVGWRAARRRA